MSKMSGQPADQAPLRAEDLSALVDGELDTQELTGLLAQWRGDESTRERWHSYQLIGDVLRSDDLASAPSHDGDFLARLRVRLDAEPVVLVPSMPVATVAAKAQVTPLSAPGRRGQRRWGRWGANAAMAAGLAVVVVGAVNVLRPSPQGTELAAAPVAPARGLSGNNGVLAVDAQANEPAVQVVNGRLIRDARLDHYLAAHQQLSGGSLLGGQAVYVRRAVAEVPER